MNESSGLAEGSQSKDDPSESYRMLSESGMNKGAAAATLSYMSDMKALGFLDKWREVSCPDGSKARVLKNPNEAFELYAKEWTSKFSVVLDSLNHVGVEAGAEVNKKIVKLFDNLNYVNAALQEMYKNSYLTFASTPCSEDAQKEKRTMDKIIAAVGLSLVSIKLILENADGGKLDKVNEEVLKLIDRVITMLDRNT